MRGLVALCVTLGALAWVTGALASPLAEVLGPSGNVVAAAGIGAFAYPQNGSLLSVGSSAVGANAVVLENVSLLGGRVSVARVSVWPGRHAASVEGLVVDGAPAAAGVNRVVAVGPSTFLITAQTAVSGGAVGIVGIRLSIGDAGYGAPSGTQILVGLPASPGSVAAQPKRPLPGAPSPLAIFAFEPGVGVGGSLLPPTLTAPFADETTGGQAVAIAERYLGVPYVWGGATPSGGFDCSGLAMYVYGQLGGRLTHYSGAQYHEGVSVSPTELQPGDLVFFNDSAAGPQHEGIYIGNNEFIQAPHTGDVVKISSLADPAYANSYVGAVRPYGA